MIREHAMATLRPFQGTSRWVVLAALLMSFLAGTARAETPLPPKPDRYFNDYVGIVAPDVAQRLNAKLEQFERDTTNQALVVIFPKIPEGTYLEDYTVKTAQSWGTGQKKRDNGVILFVFMADRKSRIEVGYGLEGAMPDSICGSILREVLKPQFKLNNYAAGLEQSIDAIFKASRNEYKGTGTTVAEAGASSSFSSTKFWMIIGLVIVFLIWCQMGDTMIQRGGRFVFWNLLDLMRIIVISGLSGGGGSSGGGSSGGSYSGGGGSFGGGGASGDW